MDQVRWTEEAANWLEEIHTSRTGRPLRIVLYGHYRIAYSVNVDKDVTVLGIFHGSLDIDRYLP